MDKIKNAPKKYKNSPTFFSPKKYKMGLKKAIFFVSWDYFCFFWEDF